MNKKKIYELTDKELEENIENPKIVEMIGTMQVLAYQQQKVNTLQFVYEAMCKATKLLEEEIEVNGNVD